mgnify:CR=1 FL=1
MVSNGRYFIFDVSDGRKNALGYMRMGQMVRMDT